jgi:hypothetical protein
MRLFSSSGCSLGPTAPTESPLSCFDSGRVHPNPFFQQNYAFTHFAIGAAQFAQQNDAETTGLPLRRERQCRHLE